MRIKQELDLYVHGKQWYWYLLFLLITAFFLFNVARFKLGESESLIVGPVQLLDFGIHELGHVIWGFAPAVITAAMGVGAEVFLPLLVTGVAIKYKEYFTAAMCLSWVALAMNSGGQYMADARSQAIPLVSISGDNAIHDWHFVFSHLGLLQYDHLIGNTFRAIGFTLAVAGLLFGVYLIIRMAGAHDTDKVAEAEEKSAAEHSKEIYPNAPAKPDTNLQEKPHETAPASSLYPTALHGRLAEDVEPPDAKKKS